jgi:hypothetical protein
MGEEMSKKKKQSKKNKKDDVSERELDSLVSALLTPEMIRYLLTQKDFVKATLAETRKAKKDPSDIKGLGDKYKLPADQVSDGLDDVEQMLTKMLGDVSDEV